MYKKRHSYKIQIQSRDCVLAIAYTTNCEPWACTRQNRYAMWCGSSATVRGHVLQPRLWCNCKQWNHFTVFRCRGVAIAWTVFKQTNTRAHRYTLHRCTTHTHTPYDVLAVGTEWIERKWNSWMCLMFVYRQQAPTHTPNDRVVVVVERRLHQHTCVGVTIHRACSLFGASVIWFNLYNSCFYFRRSSSGFFPSHSIHVHCVHESTFDHMQIKRRNAMRNDSRKIAKFRTTSFQMWRSQTCALAEDGKEIRMGINVEMDFCHLSPNMLRPFARNGYYNSWCVRKVSRKYYSINSRPTTGHVGRASSSLCMYKCTMYIVHAGIGDQLSNLIVFRLRTGQRSCDRFTRRFNNSNNNSSS